MCWLERLMSHGRGRVNELENSAWDLFVCSVSFVALARLLRLDSSVFIGSSVWYGRPFACYVGRHPIFVCLLVVSIAHRPCRFFVPWGELIGWINF